MPDHGFARGNGFKFKIGKQMNKILEQEDKQYNTGLVLSGGAYRGLGQVGALKALLEWGIVPDVVCGTSSGAINAALYASGYTPEEMLEIWHKEPMAKTLNFHLPKFGLMKHSKIGALMKPYLRYSRLEDLPVTTLLTSSCLNDGRQEVFTQGELILLLEAACAVPVVYEPVEINGEQFVDGGLVSNLPAEPLRGKCQRLIGISVNPIPYKQKIDGFTDTVYRTIWVGLEGTVQKTREYCDWFIAPPELGEHGFTERAALDLFYNAGYDYTVRFLEEQGVLKP